VVSIVGPIGGIDRADATEVVYAGPVATTDVRADAVDNFDSGTGCVRNVRRTGGSQPNVRRCSFDIGDVRRAGGVILAHDSNPHRRGGLRGATFRANPHRVRRCGARSSDYGDDCRGQNELGPSAPPSRCSTRCGTHGNMSPNYGWLMCLPGRTSMGLAFRWYEWPPDMMLDRGQFDLRWVTTPPQLIATGPGTDA